ncbi:hypothetical protein PanWU01x14_240100 [Parasponia andersonii]|uniref:Uncharacterized protein n=1 Tax=Parasponia andersonii TaxID=3476 RepID=A0A2P5BGV7_PARAD|nr:hypothetical protein PanWU01x14_240100 [Parasponia andersonii]
MYFLAPIQTIHPHLPPRNNRPDPKTPTPRFHSPWLVLRSVSLLPQYHNYAAALKAEANALS